jgi:hypothetical protein
MIAYFLVISAFCHIVFLFYRLFDRRLIPLGFSPRLENTEGLTEADMNAIYEQLLKTGKVDHKPIKNEYKHYFKISKFVQSSPNRKRKIECLHDENSSS